jgi:hypothetical protein
VRAPGNAEVEAAIEAVLQLLGPDWSPKKSRHTPTQRVIWVEAFICIVRAPDEVMPTHVRNYLLKLLHQEPHRPGRRTYQGGRDVCIAEAVSDVVERGFPPTRNNASRDNALREKDVAESACSIVQKALARLKVDIDETVIEAIWANRPR